MCVPLLGMTHVGPATALQRVALAILGYLLGFLALAVFASLAFSGGTPTDERFVFAFEVAGSLAAAELAFLAHRAAPANRLIVGANLWLVAGGVAGFTEQWWWLQTYRQLGESGLFLSMLVVGLLTVFSPAGFVAAHGERRRVVGASAVLFAAVVAALLASVRFRGTVQWAAVVPVIALSWLNRFLKAGVSRGA